MRLLLLTFLLALGCAAPAQLLIRNVSITDVEAKKILPPRDVLIQGSRIAAIGKNLKAAEGVTVIDGTGQWLMPGLVDAHVHFFQSGGLYARPDAIDLRKTRPYAEEIAWTHRHMEDLLRRYTAAGITSVVDVGASTNFLTQRDSFNAAPYAPAVYMTGPLLTTWEPEVYKGLGGDAPFYLMKSPEDARAGVRQQLPFKPDFIKIWYIVAGRNVDSAARASLPLVQAAIDEAHRAGLRVAVHATELITAKLAVEAGADLLVHGVEDGPVDAAFMKLLMTKGTVLSPTLVVAGNYSKVLGQTYVPTATDLRWAHPAPVVSAMDLKTDSDTTLARRYRTGISRRAAAGRSEDSLRAANLKMLAAGGVTLATGTDAGNIGTQHVSSYWDELAAMEAAGLDGWALLQASTINGAKAVGKGGEFGAVKVGFRADLLLTKGDPSRDWRHWQAPTTIVRNGTPWHPDSLIRWTPETLADAQLAAYNAHNLEAFLAPYSDDVEIYDLQSGKLATKGKEAMRKRYGFLSTVKVLHCRLLNRIVQGSIVVDHEEIWLEGDRKVYGMAIYETKGDKIVKVWFPR